MATAAVRMRAEPDKRLHVAQIFRTVDPVSGGPFAYLSSLKRALHHHPVDVTVISVFDKEDDSRILALRSPLHFFQKLVSTTGTLDVLHIHGIFGWHVLIAVCHAKRHGLPYVISTHGHLYPGALAQKPFRKGFYLSCVGRQIIRNAAAVLVTTSAESETVRKQVPQAATALVPPGVAMPEPLEAMPHRRHGGDVEKLRVLYLGRLHPHKNLDVLLDAMSVVIQGGVAGELWIAGDGNKKYVEALRARAGHLGLTEHVRFTGHVRNEEKIKLLREASVLVLPSRSENFGFSVAESLAMGIPVIVSAEVGLADLVLDRMCGTVVPVGDSGAIARALVSYADPGFREQQGRRALDAACEVLSLSVMGAALERVYRAARKDARINQ